MPVDVFREVRVHVSARDAVRLYGIEFDRRGWAQCPFHSDTKPSISFKGERFKCFACGVSGDAIDFVSRYFGISGVEAVRKLNADFKLGLTFGAQTRKEESRRLQEIAHAHAAFEEWRDRMIRRLNEVYRLAHSALQMLPEPLTEQQELAIRYQAQAEYCADTLEAGTPEEQAQIYQERGALTKWTERILKD